MPPTRVLLWSAPRSMSTAFERSIRELDGVKVIHQPHSMAYYNYLFESENPRAPNQDMCMPVVMRFCLQDTTTTKPSSQKIWGILFPRKGFQFTFRESSLTSSTHF